MDKELLQSISDIAKGHEVYLYGKSFFQVLNNNYSKFLQIWIKSKVDVPFDTKARLNNLNIPIQFVVSDENPCNNELLTSYQLYVDIKDVIADTAEVRGSEQALHDLSFRNVQFTTLGKAEIGNKPELILEAFLLAVKYDFTIEINTLNFILKKKQLLRTLIPHKKMQYIKDIAMMAKKRRKSFATFNALGFSQIMFGDNITESAYLNHIARRDFNAFFAVAFKRIKLEELDTFLINNFNMYLKDVEIVKILRGISDNPPTDQSDAKLLEIVKSLQADKILHLRKFFKAHGLNIFYQNIKKLKDNNVIVNKTLPFTYKRLQVLFNIDAMAAKRLLDKARTLCITNPSLYNNSAQLLIELSKTKEV